MPRTNKPTKEEKIGILADDVFVGLNVCTSDGAGLGSILIGASVGTGVLETAAVVGAIVTPDGSGDEAAPEAMALEIGRAHV